MKVYEAVNDKDNLIRGNKYVGYSFGLSAKTEKDIKLTHFMSSNRLVQLNKTIFTNEVNLILVVDDVSIGLNPSAKPIPRGNRGAK